MEIQKRVVNQFRLLQRLEEKIGRAKEGIYVRTLASPHFGSELGSEYFLSFISTSFMLLITAW